jgi:hypothetical protein
MIHQILPVVIEELNEYLKSKFNAIEDKVVLSGIIDQDGSLAIEGSNKIIATLVFIDREVTAKSNVSSQLSGSQYIEFSPPVNINLTILFSAMFNKNHYIESLKYISGVIYFFQNKFLFNPQNTPKLGKNIDKLHFDLLTIPPQELMNIYSMLGAKYTPSVIYKIKMLTFSQDNIINEIPAIRSGDVQLNP